MSVFSAFQKAWGQRFPDCELPQAWEEDVRANLIKHRERVSLLKEEVEKEEFYVEYLEKLLADAEKVKHSARDDHSAVFSASKFDDASNSTENEVVNTQDDSDIDILSLSAVQNNENVVQKNSQTVPDSKSTPNVTETEVNLFSQSDQNVLNSISHVTELTVGNGKKQTSKTEPVTAGLKSQKSSYVTVIEVGCDSNEQKTSLTTKQPSEKTPTSSPKAIGKLISLPTSNLSSDGSNNTTSQKKKKPPTPPPKKPRQPVSAITPVFHPSREKPKASFTNIANEIETKLCLTAVNNENNENFLEKDLSCKHSKIGRSFSASSGNEAFNDYAHTSPICTFSTFRPSISSINEKEDFKDESGLLSKSHSSGTNSSCSSNSSPSFTQQTLSVTNFKKPIVSDEEFSDNICVKDKIDENEENSYSEEALYDTVAIDEDLEPPNLVAQQDSSSSQLDTLVPFEEDDDEGDYVVFSERAILGYQDRQAAYNQSPQASVTETNIESPVLQEQDGCNSPSFSTYVNIDYFLKNNLEGKPSVSQEEVLIVDSDDDGFHMHSLSSDQELDNDPSCSGAEEKLVQTVTPTTTTDDVFELDSGVYSSSVESASFLQPSEASGNQPSKKTQDTEHDTNFIKAETERLTMQKCIISNTLESESTYVDCLTTLLQYMKALKSNITTSQPLLSSEDINIIFYKIADLHVIHSKFLESLMSYVNNSDSETSVCESFKSLASKLDVYAAYLRNYSKAVETVRKCSLENSKFSELTRDLLRYAPESHPDYKTLKTALKMTQRFLNELNLSTRESMFPAQDRAQRHLVKNSFIIELSEGHRKLRHLFLFNDVIVCAKYKPSTRQKFTFEVKWYIPLAEVLLSDPDDTEDVRESSPTDVLTLKSRASTVRDQILKEERNTQAKEKPKGACRSLDKQRKKLSELEAQLVLASPNLLFRVGHRNNKIYTFFLSSEFDRSQWIEAISVLQASVSTVTPSLSIYELQTWITSCRKYLETNLGSFLLRSDKDEDLLVGDLHIVTQRLHGLSHPIDVFICIEVDSYGHFFKKAKTKTLKNSIEPYFNQDFVIELEGSQTLRILCYEDHPSQGNILRGKAALELSRSWLTDKLQEKSVSLQEYMLTLSIKFVPPEMILRRIPSSKTVGMFGVKIQQVCKKEKNTIPFIITSCIREVEKRGMNEVGIYRVSGSASDVQRLKKTFETNLYEAEQLLKEVDIHTVTGLLKLYLRELPDSLFTDSLYNMFFEAFSLQDQDARMKGLLSLFHSLPSINQGVIRKLLDHMVKINQHENHNKMSLHNLATVFGPNILRPGAYSTNSKSADILAASTVDVMAQAGILYFFLKRQEAGLPLTVESPK
ncbi:active breakpoint cluster region-related protein-like [Limulus polyphemus]|uniref:Active breakpoint cluster region-related protein-like n=1 Tax=Limulus polyphemus TaxID=6850 RepID=A0ABM1TBC9_LIMPO|nr:active breakpoint cluster region-related protein-like [Limulus polyphemus]